MSDVHIEEHESLIKTPKQLVVVVVAAFAVLIALPLMISQYVTTGINIDERSPAMKPDAVAERLQPVGQVAVEAAAPAAKVEKTGEEVVKAVCGACHSTGALNAPKIGDAGAWGKLAKEGLEHLTEVAIKGVNQMPARGGNAALTDTEIARAIAYMANQSGQSLKEPAVAAAAKEEPKQDAAEKEDAKAAPAAAAGAAAVDGKAVYEKTCVACHMAGVAGAPKAGDKAVWAPRIAEGKNHLYEHAIKGKGAMPPKGGNPGLSDAEVKAAVDYLVSLAK